MAIFNNFKIAFFKNILIKKAIIDTNFYLIAQIGTKLLGLLTIPFLVRLLSVEDFALYDMFLMSSNLISIFVVLGIDSGVAIMIADHKDNKDVTNFLFTYSLLISIFILILIWLFAFLLIPLIPKFRLLSGYINYIFLYTLFNFISYQVFNFIRWNGMAKTASFISFVSYTLGVLFGFILIYFKQTPQIKDYLQGLMVGNFFGALSSLIFSYKYFTFKITKIKILYFKELITISIPFVPNYLASNLMMMGDRMLIYSILGEKSLGIYALANRFAQIPNFILNIITRGFQPVMYLNYKEIEGKSIIKKIYQYSHYLFIPGFLFMIFFSGYLVQIFGGEKYVNAIPLIPIITISTLIYGIMGLNGMGYTISRKTYLITFISLLSIILNTCINYILALNFGIIGVAIGTLCVACFTSILYTYISERLYPFNLKIKQAILIYFIVILLSYITIYYK